MGGEDFFKRRRLRRVQANPRSSMSGAYMVAGSYNIPNTRLKGYCVYTTQCRGGYFRAPGETQTLFAVESHMDLMAEALGMDPIEFRRLNALKEGDTRATGESLEDPHCIDVSTGWPDFRMEEEATQAAAGNKLFGAAWRSAIATSATASRASNAAGERRLAQAFQRRRRSGRRRLHDAPSGAAELLGIEPDSITIEVRDTSNAPLRQGSKAREERTSKARRYRARRVP